MSQQDVQAQVMAYYQYQQAGMSAQDAFKKAFPNGIPTRQQVTEGLAKDQQKAAIGQIGGVLAGALGAKAASNFITTGSVFGKGGLGGAFGGMFGGGSGATAGAGTTSAGVATPEILSATDIGAAPAAEAGMGLSGIAIPAGAAITAALAGKAGWDMLHGETPKGLAGQFGRVSLGIGTGGLSEALNFALNHRKTTRDVAKEHTADLLDQGQDNPQWQQYVTGMRQQYNEAPPDPSNPFHGGQYASWEDYVKGGLDAKDLTGVYGNLNTFGPDWAKYTDEQRQGITQLGIDNGLYNSHKGEVVVTDPEKFKALAMQYLGQGQQPPGAVLNQSLRPLGM